MYVLECKSKDPLTGEWTEKGQIHTDWESFALDATTFEHHGQQYLVWAQSDPNIPGNSNLYIAQMENPWTIKSPQVMLTKPELPWETIGFLVNEGAAVLKRNGKIFITYSASATDHNYCMGMISIPDTKDVLNPDNWSKSQTPVFATCEPNGQYGPGHNSFTVSEDGEDLIVYHARNYKEIVGDPLNDPNRHTRVQGFTWNADGTPNFGVPRADNVEGSIRRARKTGLSQKGMRERCNRSVRRGTAKIKRRSYPAGRYKTFRDSSFVLCPYLIYFCLWLIVVKPQDNILIVIAEALAEQSDSADMYPIPFLRKSLRSTDDPIRSLARV